MPERTYTAEEVQDLTDRVFLLRAQLEQGKIHIAEHLAAEFEKSIAAIRMGANGLVDPSSVDGRIRAMTLAIRAFKQRAELKDLYSLGDIQEMYFQFLDAQFGQFLTPMLKAGASPAQAAKALVRDPRFVRNSLDVLPDLIKEVREFWRQVADIGAIHLEDGRQLKATFAGDIFPGHWENVVSTAGLYIDTIVLPCPIMRLAQIVEVERTAETVERFLKHVLTAMTYRPLATASVEPPIVVVLPSEREISAEPKELITRAGPLSLRHGRYLFDRNFESFDHLADFLVDLPDIDDVLRELKGGDRLLFDSDWPRNPRDQLRNALEQRYPLPPGFDRDHAGYQVLGICLGRMPQALDARLKATGFGGTPLITAETSWEYYTWMLEYAADPESRKGSKDSHIVHALTSGAAGLEWLGNVPTETVLEIRKNGQGGEIRDMLGRGVDSLVRINAENYARTANLVADNLDSAFRKHQELLREAKQKQLRFYGIDVGSCAVVGAIAVAAAFTANSALGGVSGILGVAGAPNLKDLRSKYVKLQEEELARQRTPTGLLFKHVK